MQLVKFIYGNWSEIFILLTLFFLIKQYYTIKRFVDPLKRLAFYLTLNVEQSEMYRILQSKRRIFI